MSAIDAWLDGLPDSDLPNSYKVYEARNWLATVRSKALCTEPGGVLSTDLSKVYMQIAARRMLPEQRNGYIRELLLRWALEEGVEHAMPCLLACLNDYVPKIRQLAAKHLPTHLLEVSSEGLLGCLDLFLVLSRKSRVNHQPILEMLRARLVRDRQQALHYLKGLDGNLACFLFELLKSLEGREELLELALQHQHVLMRQRALELALELGGEWPGKAHRALLNDRSARLRSQALYALIKAEPSCPQLKTWISQALLDPSGAVRQLARWAAPQYEVPVISLVRQALIELPQKKAAWQGLLGAIGELSLSDTQPLLRQLLQDPRASLRHQALYLLCRFDPLASQADCLKLVHDPSLRLSRLALQHLRRFDHPQGVQLVQQVIQRHQAAGELHKALQLCSLLPAEQCLYWILHGAQSAREADCRLWRVVFVRQQRRFPWDALQRLSPQLRELGLYL